MKALFVVNPVSGPKWKNLPKAMMEKIINTPRVEIIETKHAGHASELAKMAIGEKCESVIAVGGDGTVHEIGTALIGSETALGIIPMGSGNGYARSMGIPLNIEKAIEHALNAKSKRMDTALVNDRPFLGVAGWGFDAVVAHRFAELKRRGFANYVKTSMRLVLKYKANAYQIEVNGGQIDQKAFSVIAANTSQFGNNAQVSPGSVPNDGLLELVIVDPLKLRYIPGMTRRMFNGSIERSKFVRIIKASEFKIRTENKMAHLDGEPIFLDKEIVVKVVPASLLVLAGN